MAICRSLLAVMTFLSCVAASASSARPNGQLIFSLPVADSTIPTSPQEIVLTFNEVVKPVRIRVADPHGKAIIGIGVAEPEAQTFRIPVPHTLDDGKVVVLYQVITDTGRVMAGVVDFSIQTPKPKKQRSPARLAKKDGHHTSIADDEAK